MIDLSCLQDDGYETVRLLDKEGNLVYEAQIDLWEAHNHLADIQQKTKGKPAYEYHTAVVDFLKEKGFPEVSHRFADRFVAGIIARVA